VGVMVQNKVALLWTTMAMSIHWCLSIWTYRRCGSGQSTAFYSL